MGGKPTKESSGVSGASGSGSSGEGRARASKEEEDGWMTTLNKQEGDAKFNTATRVKAAKKGLKAVFTSKPLTSFPLTAERTVEMK